MIRLFLRALPLPLLFAPATTYAASAEHSLARYAHTRWMRDDGAPVPVRGFSEDAKGFLWLAGADGLYRFDGVRFEKIGGTQSNCRVDQVLGGRGGEVYAWLPDQKSLGIFADGRLRIVRRPPFKSPGPAQVVELRQAKDGAVWVGFGQFGLPVLRYYRGRWSRFDVSSGLPRQQLMSILPTNDGAVWLSYVGAVVRLAPGASRFERIPVRSGTVGKLAADPGGNVWMIERRGSYILRNASGTGPGSPRIIHATDPSRRRGRSLIDHHGDIWTATRSDGLERLRVEGDVGGVERAERMTAAAGLSGNSLDSIFEDREGAVWVASSRGIDRFRRADIVAEPALTRMAAFGNILFAGKDGSVYVGQKDGVWRIRPKGVPEVLLSGLDEPEAICEDHSGALIVADAHTVFRVANGVIRRLPRPPTDTGIYDCTFDRLGRLWMSAASSGMYVWQEGAWRPILLEYRKAGFNPNGMLRERSGAIALYWAPGTIARIDALGRPSMLLHSGSPLGEPQMLLESAQGLFATGEHGLALLRDGKSFYLLNDRIPELRHLNGMVQTRAGETWLLGSAGLLRTSTAELSRSFASSTLKPSFKVFGASEGMPDLYSAESMRSLVQGGDGRIWLDTLAGTAWIDPAAVIKSVRPPTAVVTSLRASDGMRLDPVDVPLARGIGNVEFSYAGLGIASPERARFRYRLVGNDKGWVDAGSRRQAFYTNLRPGSYRFEVAAANEDGVWSAEPAAVTVRVQPTFLQSWTFIWMLVITTVLLLWVAYRWRLGGVTRKLAQAHAERVDERERIARELHDTLLQGVQGLILTFQGVAGRLTAAEAEKSRVHDALKRADAVMIDGRDRVRGLRVGIGSDGLEEALREQVALADFDKSTTIRFATMGTPPTLRPEEGAELAAIAGEALLNASRHAGASMVEVNLDYRRDRTIVEVADNGIGLVQPCASKVAADRYGILGMRERAARIGATFSIGATKDGGTVVRIELRPRGWRSRALDVLRPRRARMERE